MNNIEELTSKARIERLKSKFEIAKSYSSDQLTVPMPDLEALIAQLEAAQKESAIRLEAIEQMRKTVAHNVERAQTAEAALSAANEPWRSFVTNDDISALNRFAECCDDPESGGHDLDKDQVERLVSIGALRKTKRNYHETTDFGDFVISAGFTVEGNADAE
ncbi:hypothetical protein DVP62_17430 [Yersinia enterocolitica]|nr:hypothetical protein [Yersinia enterocolitica]EKN6262897.1 hypothetical protein [Yersinia enterocolitica]HDL7128112.1 hypothetical protein [Yersinia enterocolitica]HDL7946552.1 hypothetical protein [Yersinia enterocolitica]HEI6725060.1 hypothetical protein [Yersinia enterocolitica]